MRLVAIAALAAVVPALALTALALPAEAQSAQNGVTASKQTSIAAGAIAESGVRTTSGVVAIPLGATAVASGAVGVGAAASGQFEVANGFSDAAGGASRSARKMVEFSNAPLTIGDDIVIAKPQPAPKVPFTPAGQ